MHLRWCVAAIIRLVTAMRRNISPSSRELAVTQDQRTLLLTDFALKNLALIDVGRLPLVLRQR